MLQNHLAWREKHISRPTPQAFDRFIHEYRFPQRSAVKEASEGRRGGGAEGGIQ